MTQNRSAGVRHSNERLEFLGDAVLDAIVGDFLYHYYPDEDEGILTKARSKLVSRSHLKHLAKATGLVNMLKSDVKNQEALLNLAGNAFEALIGAIYLRKGYPFVQKRLIRLIKRFTNVDDFLTIDDDHKSKVYQWIQKNKKTLLFKSKETKLKQEFEVELYIDGELICGAIGTTKKSAEQAASEKAINLLKIN